MLRWFIASGLVLATVAPVFAQFAQPGASPGTQPPDPYTNMRDWPRGGWDHRETPEQTRQRLEREREFRTRTPFEPSPGYKPGFEPRPQQPNVNPDSSSWPRSR